MGWEPRCLSASQNADLMLTYQYFGKDLFELRYASKRMTLANPENRTSIHHIQNINLRAQVMQLRPMRSFVRCFRVAWLLLNNWYKPQVRPLWISLVDQAGPWSSSDCPTYD